MVAVNLSRLLLDVGSTIRGVRLSMRLTQRELGRRSGMSQPEVSRIERGLLPGVSFASIDRLCTSLAIRYSFNWSLPIVHAAPLDVVHARCTAYVERRLARTGWLVDREVEVGGDRSRGWIDVLAFHPTMRTLLMVEVKTEIRDIGAIERQLNWHAREAAAIARRRRWSSARAASVLLVLHSEENDLVIQRAAPVFALAFPGRASALRLAVAGKQDFVQPRYLAMIDPRVRRHRWLAACRVDGRRTHAPFRDYLDAVRALETHRRQG